MFNDTKALPQSLSAKYRRRLLLYEPKPRLGPRVFRITHEEPQHDRQKENDTARPGDEFLGAVPHGTQHGLEMRNTVGRQFKHERHPVSLKKCFPEKCGDPQSGPDTQKIKPEKRQPLKMQKMEHVNVRNECRDQKCVNRKPGTATHQGRHKDRCEPVVSVLDRTRRKHPGDRAREGAQERQERFPVQSHFFHEFVEHEHRTRHVTRIFKKRDEKEKQEDLRQKNDHIPDARDNTVYHKASKSPLRQPCLGKTAHFFYDPGKKIHRRLGPGEDRLEDDAHDHDENSKTPNAMRQDPVHLVRKSLRLLNCSPDDLGAKMIDRPVPAFRFHGGPVDPVLF